MSEFRDATLAEGAAQEGPAPQKIGEFSRATSAAMMPRHTAMTRGQRHRGRPGQPRHARASRERRARGSLERVTKRPRQGTGTISCGSPQLRSAAAARGSDPQRQPAASPTASDPSPRGEPPSRPPPRRSLQRREIRPAPSQRLGVLGPTDPCATD
jgi:hypothetical protein